MKINIFKAILIGINKALKVLNKKGIIHRDIRPSNIFIKGKNQIKLGGFDYAVYIKDKSCE